MCDSLFPEERRNLKQSKGARANHGIPQLRRGDCKSFREWYAVSKRGRESSAAKQWVEALAEWPTTTVNVEEELDDGPLYDSEPEDFPFDSLESVSNTTPV